MVFAALWCHASEPDKRQTMLDNDPNPGIDEQAALWLLRSHAPDLSATDIEMLSAWLDASPDHVAAFDRAELAWFELPAATLSDPAATTDASLRRIVPLVPGLAARPAPSSPSRWKQGAMAAGLVATALITGTVVHGLSGTKYQTSRNETRDILLADGSRMQLAPGTRAHVVLREHFRRIDLTAGALALRVKHDDDAPFAVRAGDQTTTDIGTAFTVTRDSDGVKVVVTEGVVAVRLDTAKDAPTLVRAGFESQHTIGSPLVSVTAVTVPGGRERPAQVTYLDRSLSDVVKELNGWFEIPIEVDREARSLKVSAVISLDSEEAVVRRLQAFLPVQAIATDHKIRLRRRKS